MATPEIWRPIPNTGGFYEASSLGRVRSRDRIVEQAWRDGVRSVKYAGRVLTPWADGNGYPTVYLSNRKAVNVHRLVALAFHGESDGREVNHIDGDKSNCRADNLEWLTHGQNIAHAYNSGLLKTRKAIIAEPRDGGPAIHFESVAAAAAAMNGSRGNITQVAVGKWPSAYGYRWRFAGEAA